MKDRYIFPAIFETNDNSDALTVTFPDLPGCITEGDGLEDALKMAKEALSLHLFSMEEDDEEIPEPTFPAAIEAPPGGFVSLVEVWMPPFRAADNRAVTKSVTLPKWLIELGDENGVNFSKMLQNALRSHLGVSDLEQPRDVRRHKK